MQFMIKHQRPDHTYVIELNGYPYHVIHGDPMYAAVSEQAANQVFMEELPPQAPPITQISMSQLRQQLHMMQLLQTVNSHISQASAQTQIAWEYETHVQKDSELVKQIQLATQLDSDQFTVLFEQAATL
jgi:hypothetical protein